MACPSRSVSRRSARPPSPRSAADSSGREWMKGRGEGGAGASRLALLAGDRGAAGDGERDRGRAAAGDGDGGGDEDDGGGARASAVAGVTLVSAAAAGGDTSTVGLGREPSEASVLGPCRLRWALSWYDLSTFLRCGLQPWRLPPRVSMAGCVWSLVTCCARHGSAQHLSALEDGKQGPELEESLHAELRRHTLNSNCHITHAHAHRPGGVMEGAHARDYALLLLPAVRLAVAIVVYDFGARTGLADRLSGPHADVSLAATPGGD